MKAKEVSQVKAVGAVKKDRTNSNAKGGMCLDSMVKNKSLAEQRRKRTVQDSHFLHLDAEKAQCLDHVNFERILHTSAQ